MPQYRRSTPRHTAATLVVLLLLASLIVSNNTVAQTPILGDRVLIGTLNFCTATGSVNAYSCSLGYTLSAYVTDMLYSFTANAANTGAATISFNGLAAVTIKKRIGGVSTDLAANDIGTSQRVLLQYDGTNMQMLSQPGTTATGLSGLLQGNGTSPVTAITNSTTVGQVLRVTGSNAYGWGALDLADTDAVTGILPAANHPTTLRTRALVFELGDEQAASALATTAVTYATIPFACTLSAYTLITDVADATIRVKFWRVATGGTAKPAVGNSINTSGLGVPSGTRVNSTNVTDFTSTAIAKDDSLAMAISTAGTAKMVSATLECIQ